jgi:hypothetical protein
MVGGCRRRLLRTRLISSGGNFFFTDPSTFSLVSAHSSGVASSPKYRSLSAASSNAWELSRVGGRIEPRKTAAEHSPARPVIQAMQPALDLEYGCRGRQWDRNDMMKA